jgi:hypothetical protein
MKARDIGLEGFNAPADLNALHVWQLAGRKATIRLKRDREFADSPVERDGFELLVPWRRVVDFGDPPRFRSSFDSPLEEEGFEPSVPEKARLKGSGRLKVLPGLRYAGGPLERATFGFPCGAENPVICLHRHAPLPS